MEKKDKQSKANINNEEMLELEYELLESSEKRRPKRLRSKENKSKKSSSQLVEGRVIECFTNNYYRVRVGTEEYLCPLSGRFKNVDFASTKTILVIGDIVQVDLSDEPRIEEINDRKNYLSRFISQHSGRETEVVLAANIDQVIITASYQQPPLNLNLVDRYICAAELTGIIPVICITKIDLLDDSEDIEKQKKKLAADLQYYRQNGYTTVMVSPVTEAGMDKLQRLLKDRITVFSGLSGTGKTTIVNYIEPGINLKTGTVSSFSNKGKHTTSSSKMIEWSFGGHLIDTPGIKTFGLPREAKDRIPKIFPGFDRLHTKCRFNSCSHRQEIDCAVLKALEQGLLPAERYSSYLNIYASLAEQFR